MYYEGELNWGTICTIDVQEHRITAYNCMNTTSLATCLPLQYEIRNNNNSEPTKNHIEWTRSMPLCFHVKILRRKTNSSIKQYWFKQIKISQCIFYSQDGNIYSFILIWYSQASHGHSANQNRFWDNLWQPWFPVKFLSLSFSAIHEVETSSQTPTPNMRMIKSLKYF